MAQLASSASSASSAGNASRPPRRLRVAVEWGDICQAPGDVLAVGHYHGILPVQAEAALDRVISEPAPGSEDPAAGEAGEPPRVLAQHAQLGLLLGSLGAVQFYPWPGQPRLVAVCGMGHPGAFGERELRLLYRNLTWSVALLPASRHLTTVLIGTGKGGLGVEAAVRSLLQGLGEALRPLGGSGLEELRIVELSRSRARQIQAALHAGKDAAGLELDLAPEVVDGKGGKVFHEYRLALLVAAAAQAQGEGESRDRGAVTRLLHLAAGELGDPEGARETLERLYEGRGRNLVEVAGSLLMELRQDGGGSSVNPTRISYITDFLRTGAADGEGKRQARRLVRVAAITDTATIPEREVHADPKLIAEVVRSMIDPPPEEVERFASFLNRLVVPRDFRELLDRSEPLVFEVDRHTAAVHWEMLGSSRDGRALRPIALERQVARQLRTTYATTPTLQARRDGPLRALLVGDPGDPTRGEDLPGAQQETVAVRDLLQGFGIEVHLLVGAPNAKLLPALIGCKRATRATVLEQLMSGDFDLLHYAGHGDFDPEDPSWVGWLFHDGLLTANEIELVDRAPALIVANACLSARTSEVGAGGGEVRGARGEASLLPSLADEFFRRGVQHYVGTAWEVDDEGAVSFAKSLYRSFLGEGRTLGEALLQARQELAAETGRYRSLWAAYQHYGDPRLTRKDLEGPLAAGP